MSTNQNFQGDPNLPPPEPPTIPPANFRESGKAMGDGYADSKAPDIITAKALLGAEDWWMKQLATLLSKVAGICMYLVRGYMFFREHLDPTIARFSSLAASDLFGSPVVVDEFNKLGPEPTRQEVGRILGKQMLNAITGTYATHPGGTIEPSEEAAEQFLATMADLAVEGWFDHAIAGIISEHPTEAFGQLKDVFGKVFGFGRLSRRVLGPYMAELIEKPVQLTLNKRYRPTVLSQGQLIKKWWNGKIDRATLNEKLARLGFADDVIQDLIDEDLPVLTPSQLVHQYNRGIIDRPTLNARLAKRGFPDDVIEALTVEGRKYIGTTDIAFLVRNGYWKVEKAVAEYRNQGYSDALARQLLEVDRLQQVDTARQSVVAAARALYLSGDFTANQYRSFQERAKIEPEVIDLNMLAAGVTLEGERKKLSESDAETAVIRGFWTMTEYQTYLRSLHYFEDDIITKTLLIADRIQQDDAAKKKRADAEKARADARAAKLAAAQQRQAELEALRLHPQLTLAQVAAATVRGMLTVDQYSDFLRGQNYSEEDITILADMVSADRADYLTAQVRRQRADAKLATTSLTVAQLEKGVEVGALTIDDFRKTLANELVDPSDIDILVKILQTTLDAQAAASSRRDSVSSSLASKGLSLAQMEQAVRLGLMTLTDYRQRLADLGYSVVDQELLSGLLENQIALDQAAEVKRQAAEAKAADKKIPLSDLRAAVIAGLRPMSDYHQALQDLGYSPLDVDTMVSLLRSTIANSAAAAARQQSLEAASANLAAPLAIVEIAVELGMGDVSILASAVTAAGGAAEDVDVITAMVEDRAAEIDTARRLETDAAQQLALKSPNLTSLKRSLRSGSLTADAYRVVMAALGFGPQSAALLLELATMENQYTVYAVGVRSALDRTGGTREIARAAQEQTVRDGVGAITDYAAWLAANGYETFAAATLVWLLASELT